MRRIVTVAPIPIILALIGITGCSGSGSGPAPVVPTGRSGNPTDTASPTGPSPAITPTPAVVSPPTTSPVLDLPACMIGNWQAPLAREFTNLGLYTRSHGTVRGGSGTLALTFTAANKWTFRYDGVRFDLAAGSVDVSGPVDGTWSLNGSTLTTSVVTSSTTTKMSVAGATFGVPAAVTTALRDLPPNHVYVACTGSGLQFQLPTSQGGGTVTFDPA
jgi:hypothetical protein